MKRLISKLYRCTCAFITVQPSCAMSHTLLSTLNARHAIHIIRLKLQTMINLLRLIVFSAPPLALAHSRWSCPAPRSTSTGIKDGPCGDDYDVFDESTIEIQPGPLKVTFEESVHHTGAPFRISLSSMYIVLPYPIYLLLCIHHFDMLFLSNAQHISHLQILPICPFICK